MIVILKNFIDIKWSHQLSPHYTKLTKTATDFMGILFIKAVISWCGHC